MENVTFRAIESMMPSSWDYIINASYFYVPSKIKIYLQASVNSFKQE